MPDTAKRRAGGAVRKAVLRGALAPVTGLACAMCGAPAAVYHHHLGYAPEHRLTVTALCYKCHQFVHPEVARAAHAPEANAKRLVSSQGKTQHPQTAETRARIGAAFRDKPLSAEHREKISEARRAEWADPEMRAKRVALNRATGADPDARAKNSAARRAEWADPEVRAKRLAGMKARRQRNAGEAPGDVADAVLEDVDFDAGAE